MLAYPDKSIHWSRLRPIQSVQILKWTRVQQRHFDFIHRKHTPHVAGQIGRSRAAVLAELFGVYPLAGGIGGDFEL